MSERFERAIGGKKCFNHINHFNKLEIYQLLRDTEVMANLPKTLPIDKADLDTLIDQYRVCYLKPTLGKQGKGVYRVELTDSGDIYISQHHFSPSNIVRDRATLTDEIITIIGNKNYIVQQGVPNLQLDGQNFDLRALVQKQRNGLWGVTNIISRIAFSGYFNNSICETVFPATEVLERLFTLEKARNILTSISEISLKAARGIEQQGGYHLGELSVDFEADIHGKLWVIEVNGDPQRTIYRGLPSYQDVYKNPIDYALFLLHQ